MFVEFGHRYIRVSNFNALEPEVTILSLNDWSVLKEALKTNSKSLSWAIFDWFFNIPFFKNVIFCCNILFIFKQKKSSSVACWTHQSKEENNIFCFEEIFRKKVLFLCCLWIRLMLAITWYDRHSHQPTLRSFYYNGYLSIRNSTKCFMM